MPTQYITLGIIKAVTETDEPHILPREIHGGLDLKELRKHVELYGQEDVFRMLSHLHWQLIETLRGIEADKQHEKVSNSST